MADVYDALISRRCYKMPMSFDDAERTIFAENGLHFDPTIIAAFMELKYEFRNVAQRYQEGYDVNVLNIEEGAV